MFASEAKYSKGRLSVFFAQLPLPRKARGMDAEHQKAARCVAASVAPAADG